MVTCLLKRRKSIIAKNDSEKKHLIFIYYESKLYYISNKCFCLSTVNYLLIFTTYSLLSITTL